MNGPPTRYRIARGSSFCQPSEDIQQNIDPLARNRAADMEKAELVRARAMGCEELVDRPLCLSIQGIEQRRVYAQICDRDAVG